MDLPIRFCTTSDGARIAYAAIGTGPAIIAPPGWVGHLEFELTDPVRGPFFEALARHHTVVRYDRWGTGLSDRNREDFSLDADVRPLEAVTDALKLRRVILLGISAGGPPAIVYAARYPRRVSRLILYGTWADRRHAEDEKLGQAVTELVRAHWGVGSRTLADLFMPGASTEALEAYARFQRLSASAEMAALLRERARDPGLDVTELARRIRVPTLVLHRRDDSVVPFELGRTLSTLIPNARFAPLEGSVHSILTENMPPLVKAISQFIGDPVDDEPSAPPSATNSAEGSMVGVVTILFTDLAASTELLDRLGDETYELLRRTHFGLLRSAVAEHGGEEVKSLGDGLMVVFSSTLSALRCAVAMQESVRQHNEQYPETPLRVRIGLHAGEPIREEGDYFGTPVVVARRLCERAEGGKVLASDLVRELAGTRGGVRFEPLGSLTLKGFTMPVAASEVRP